MVPNLIRKKFITSVLAFGIATCCSGPVLAADDIKERETSAREAIKSLSENLKEYLKAGLEAGIDVEEKLLMCKEGAAEATSNENQERPFSIGRTSLKLRNPANAPDEWEYAILQKFQERKDSGEDAATLQHSEIVETNGKRYFRYMKAIPAGRVCLICHGTNIQPELVVALSKIYPHDEARGFTIGDIRGAFTVSQALE